MRQIDSDVRVALVTGAATGIGAAISQRLAQDGYRVLVADINLAAATATADQINTGGQGRAAALAMDVSNTESIAQAFASVAKDYGRCDVLVNSAGATRAGAFLTQPDEEWQDGFALKFYSCVRLCRLFWPMLRSAQGVVINIIGGAARTPDAEFLVGGSVNAAMANFTKGLAGLGKRDGVNVNSILPGLTQTERVQTLFEQRAAAMGITPDQARRNQVEKEGIRRLGKPEDVAELALFLADDRARHIQGTAIAVDGGATPGLY